MTPRKVTKPQDVPAALLTGIPGPLGWIGDGLALPARFTAEGSTDTAELVVDVELLERRLVARRVCVETESDRGVTAAVLRAVPIRQLIVESARRHVVRVTILGEGMSMEPANLEDEDVIEAVEAAVGYVAVPR